MDDPHSLFSFIKRLIGIRKGFKAFGRGDFAWAELDPDNKAVAAYWRSYTGETILSINNLSEKAQSIQVNSRFSCSTVIDLISSDQFPVKNDKIQFTLSPYQSSWITCTGKE